MVYPDTTSVTHKVENGIRNETVAISWIFIGFIYNTCILYMLPIIILFSIWFFIYGKICPCDVEMCNKCYRTEFYGFQYGHLFLSMLVGFLYPKQIKLWIILGVIWEIFEYWLSQRVDIVKKLGGCLTHYKGNYEGPLWMRKVYGGKPKYENFIDNLFGIKNSTEHTWHYSVGENVTNLVGFLIGSALTKR